MCPFWGGVKRKPQGTTCSFEPPSSAPRFTRSEKTRGQTKKRKKGLKTTSPRTFNKLPRPRKKGPRLFANYKRQSNPKRRGATARRGRGRSFAGLRSEETGGKSCLQQRLKRSRKPPLMRGSDFSPGISTVWGLSSWDVWRWGFPSARVSGRQLSAPNSLAPGRQMGLRLRGTHCGWWRNPFMSHHLRRPGV